MRNYNKLPVLHPASSISEMLIGGSKRMKSASGIHVIDETGRKLIDGIAGLWCANLGHGRPEIAETMSESALTLDYFHTFNGVSNDAQEILGDRLANMTPEGLNHVFFGCSGSDANDTILKIVWHYNNLKKRPQKKKIISRWGAYHGTSISTASLTGLKGFHKNFDLPLFGILHTENPHHYRFGLVEENEHAFSKRMHVELESLISKEGADTIAAFIGEPLMGAGGVVPPPEGYWEGVQDICSANDILLIADEVVCGFGRTGNDFGSQTFGIKPDLMATAKAITNGTFPFSAAFLSEEIWDVLRIASKTSGNFAHGYTYSGHPIGAAVANTVLDIYERENIAMNAKITGAYLIEQLKLKLGSHPNVGEIRGEGLVCAVQLVKSKQPREFFDPTDKVPAAISNAAYENGLIVRPLPSVGALAFSPPLIVTSSQVDEMIERFLPALNAGLPR